MGIEEVFIDPCPGCEDVVPGIVTPGGPPSPPLTRQWGGIQKKKHEDAFLKTKELLTSTFLVKPFDESKEMLMLTDASRLYELGFALIQKASDGHSISLIFCGCYSLSETQQRYATIEQECLAIKWAVNKCDFCLRGLPAFTVLTDHRPLVGIFLRQLHELENAQLMRMREKLTNFSFEVKWVKGKTHIIADVLSRTPVFQRRRKKRRSRQLYTIYK